MGMPDEDLPVLFSGVPIVVENLRVGVAKDRTCLIEAYFMFSEICLGFVVIPLAT